MVCIISGGAHRQAGVSSIGSDRPVRRDFTQEWCWSTITRQPPGNIIEAQANLAFIPLGIERVRNALSAGSRRKAPGMTGQIPGLPYMLARLMSYLTIDLSPVPAAFVGSALS
jgi:hypothetical protein